MAKMTQQEIKEWDELYEYVRSKIMNYDKNQSLSNMMVLRLKGLSTNKYMENNKTKSTSHYFYSVILNTFKYCYFDIQRGIYGLNFKDENHKFNYILKIVESKLNTVYLKMKSSELSKEKSETTDFSVIKYNGAEYQRKTKDTTNHKLDDLW